ncbi:MAG: amidohydrolase family protein [Pseudomonadota bacterium]
MPHARTLLDMLDGSHVIWGSDWPHTQHESSIDYGDTYREAIQRVEITDVDATRYLYGISNR